MAAVPDNAELVPTPGRVVVKIESNTEQKWGSLYLPQKGKDEQRFGTVYKVYEPYENDVGRLIEPVLVSGDMVLIGKYTGTEVQLNRETFIICRETDVLSRVIDLDHPARTRDPYEDELPF